MIRFHLYGHPHYLYLGVDIEDVVTDGVGDESESDPSERMADCVDRSKYTVSGGPHCRLCVTLLAYRPSLAMYPGIKVTESTTF